jgi:hypothetical protein
VGNKLGARCLGCDGLASSKAYEVVDSSALQPTLVVLPEVIAWITSGCLSLRHRKLASKTSARDTNGLVLNLASM